MPRSALDDHSLRILAACDEENHPYSDEHVRKARRAYFANISYIDDIIGKLLSILADTRQDGARRLRFFPTTGI